MKTNEIEIAISKYFGIRQNIIIPNFSYGFCFNHEMDLALITNSNYLLEFEIKVSYSDLKRDLQKPHKHFDKEGRIKSLNFAIPNYLLKYKDLIPEHAGIYVCEKVLRNNKEVIKVKCERSAKPYKNHRKLTYKEISQLLRLSNMRIWNLKEKLLNYQNKIYK